MGIAERSRARVEELLTELERTYDSFPVNQTTLSLPAERFERAREQFAEGAVDTYVEIENDDGQVLHVQENGDLELPGVVADAETALEADVCERVQDRTGITCAIAGLTEVTIAGIRNADDEDSETLYHLLVVFDGVHEAGDPESSATWHDDSRELKPAYV